MLKACQKVDRDISWMSVNATRVQGPRDYQGIDEFCEKGSTEDEARENFSQTISRVCKSSLGKEVRKCNPVGEASITIEKPNWLQRAGIAISDFFSTLLD